MGTPADSGWSEVPLVPELSLESEGGSPVGLTPNPRQCQDGGQLQDPWASEAVLVLTGKPHNRCQETGPSVGGDDDVGRGGRGHVRWAGADPRAPVPCVRAPETRPGMVTQRYLQGPGTGMFGTQEEVPANHAGGP